MKPLETAAFVVASFLFVALFATVYRWGPSVAHPSSVETREKSHVADIAPVAVSDRVASSTASESDEALQAGRQENFRCEQPRVIDGDTLACGTLYIRLASIDAPEMPGHCRRGRVCVPGDPFASTENLRRMVDGRTLTCRQIDTDRYGRTVAFCSAGGRDISCAQVAAGFAVIRYGRLSCK